MARPALRRRWEVEGEQHGHDLVPLKQSDGPSVRTCFSTGP